MMDERSMTASAAQKKQACAGGQHMQPRAEAWPVVHTLTHARTARTRTRCARAHALTHRALLLAHAPTHPAHIYAYL